MAPSTQSRLISQQHQDMLRTMVGESYKYLGGKQLDPFRNGEIVSIAATGCFLDLVCDLETRDFEGFVDEYPQIYVHETSPLIIKEMQSAGDFYVQGAGQHVRGISIVRETVVAFDSGVETWSEVSDVGILIHLDALTISIVLTARYEVFFDVDFHENFALSMLEDTAMLASEDLFRTYEVSREIIPLESKVKD